MNIIKKYFIKRKLQKLDLWKHRLEAHQDDWCFIEKMLEESERRKK